MQSAFWMLVVVPYQLLLLANLDQAQAKEIRLTNEAVVFNFGDASERAFTLADLNSLFGIQRSNLFLQWQSP
jgi:hypothetical protein